MKDYQQAIVLRRMTVDLNWPIKFIICPTVRENDGLAMSSRNSYLSPELRRQAPALYQTMKAVKALVKSGMTDTAAIREQMRQVMAEIAPAAEIEYVAFTEMESLRPRMQVQKNTVVSLAVRLGPVRLIDNMKIA
jgi:pantoate--beta-alanine ligase